MDAFISNMGTVLDNFSAYTVRLTGVMTSLTSAMTSLTSVMIGLTSVMMHALYEHYNTHTRYHTRI